MDIHIVEASSMQVVHVFEKNIVDNDVFEFFEVGKVLYGCYSFEKKIFVGSVTSAGLSSAFVVSYADIGLPGLGCLKGKGVNGHLYLFEEPPLQQALEAQRSQSMSRTINYTSSGGGNSASPTRLEHSQSNCNLI